MEMFMMIQPEKVAEERQREEREAERQGLEDDCTCACVSARHCTCAGEDRQHWLVREGSFAAESTAAFHNPEHEQCRRELA
eukprot:2557181-Rhodomonas_salina.1